MELRNHTSFPALAFEGIDQFERSFHVVVLRQTLTWNDFGQLLYAEKQEPLCEADEFFDAPNLSSVRQESDLCHYKPKCDVIVNATAHAPGGVPIPLCPVRVVVKRPDEAAPLPPRPRGLNPFVDPSKKELDAWQKAVELAQQSPIRGTHLIDKTLIVTGERELVRTSGAMGVFDALLRGATAPFSKAGTWRLKSPDLFTTAPVRYELAFGGECRVRSDAPGVERIPRNHRSASLQAGSCADAEGAAALQVFEFNHIGRGFTVPWYWQATGAMTIAAPRVENPSAPFSLQRFAALQADTSCHANFADLVAGFGVRPKVHPARRVLAGTLDTAFANSAAWLPADFDFAVWNAAPPDQQTDHLLGDEEIELTNLCRPGSAESKIDVDGNTSVKLALPGHTCRLLMRMHNGTMFYHALHIDTLVIEPELRTVSLVWRTVFEKTGEVRAVDVNLHRQFEADLLRQFRSQLETAASARLQNDTAASLGSPHG